MTSLLLFFLVVPIPPPPQPPQQPPVARLELLKRLGCECSRQERGVLQCRKLPAFGDNEWTHGRAKEFVREGSTLAARLAELSPQLPGRHYLALQGSADSREIMHVKTWSEASLKCRERHDEKEAVSNEDLAYLRACELKLLFPPSLASRITIDFVDYTNPKMRNGPRAAYMGEQFKAVTLLIIFPERSLCADTKQPSQ